MFPLERQKRLDPILEELSKIPGIRDIVQDDFDSTGINVWMELIPVNSFQFETTVASLKRNLRRTFGSSNYRVIDYPVMKWEHVSVHDRSEGDPAQRRVGFDQTRFGIEFFV